MSNYKKIRKLIDGLMEKYNDGRYIFRGINKTNKKYK